MRRHTTRIFRAVSIFLSTVLVIVVSFFIWRYVQQTVDALRDQAYETEEETALGIVSNRMSFLTNALYGLRGMVNMGGFNSTDWDNYLLATNIEDRFPGLYSFAYVDLTPKNTLSTYVGRVRATEPKETFGTFNVYPRSGGETAYPIKYMFTTDPDLMKLVGYDIGTSPVLKDLIDKTMKTGGPTLSDLVYLKLVIPSSNTVGYVVGLPVYSGNLSGPAEMVSSDVKGFVGAFVQPSKLFSGLDIVGPNGNPVGKYDVYDKDVPLIKEINGPVNLKYEKSLTLLNKNFKIVFEGPVNFRLPFFQEYLPMFTLAAAFIIVLLWYITVVSVTLSRRRAEILAREATKDLRKFKQAVDGVSDHVIITDPDGVIIYANPAASKITGYSNKEMLGKRPSLWGKQMEKDFYKQMWHTIKTEKKPFYDQVKNKRKNGAIYEAEIHISPIMNEHNEVIYFVGIERDITKEKAIERMKTEFISLASHQLRTPLSAVKWFGKMLLDGDAGKLTKVQKEYLQKINLSNEREIQLVNSLLNISRIESGRIIVVPKLTDMKKYIKGIISDTQISLEEKKRDVSLKIEGQIPKMMIDPDLTRHVYMNLLTNAINYTDAGGKIAVTVKVKGKKLLTTISDNGIGIPKAEQYRVFGRFFRASNAVKKETEGSGLGLYLAKTIVESSGGKIWFKSEVNKGTTFYFTLPLKGVKPKKGDVKLT